MKARINQMTNLKKTRENQNHNHFYYFVKNKKTKENKKLIKQLKLQIPTDYDIIIKKGENKNEK